VSGFRATNKFSTIITDIIPEHAFIDNSQCFPRYWYEKVENHEKSLFDSKNMHIIDGYYQKDGITDWILDECNGKYSKEIPIISKDMIFYYVYSMLHSSEYREKFSADLTKVLPRIPLVAKATDFLAFSEMGKALAALHLGYETVKPYAGVKVTGAEKGNFIVEKLRFGKGVDGKDDKTVIQYNASIRIENIPLEVYKYVVNGKSAIDWVMDRYQVRINKDSGIRNDPNDWAREHDQPRYILDLLLRVITVSLETMRLVKGLPKIDFT
jgi:predicted helicase